MREGLYDYQKDTQDANGMLNGTLSGTEEKKQKIKELISKKPKITENDAGDQLYRWGKKRTLGNRNESRLIIDILINL